MNITVDDPEDPAVVPFLGLRDHAVRQVREQPGGDMAGAFMAEGDVVIGRALDAAMTPLAVLMDAKRPSELPDWPDTAPRLHAGPDVLRSVSGRPRLRDPIAMFVRPEPATAAELLATASTVAVFEGVVNPTNVGVIVRCAAGLGVDAVLVDPTSCDPLYRRAVRVSMGEVFRIPHARIGDLPSSLDVLDAAGFSTLALTPAADAVDIGSIDRTPDRRVAIVIGSEGPGLSAATLERADARVCIPMAAGVDSINVAAAAAIAFQALRI